MIKPVKRNKRLKINVNDKEFEFVEITDEMMRPLSFEISPCTAPNLKDIEQFPSDYCWSECQKPPRGARGVVSVNLTDRGFFEKIKGRVKK